MNYRHDELAAQHASISQDEGEMVLDKEGRQYGLRVLSPPQMRLRDKFRARLRQ